ncbi:ABC transporter permease [Dyella choica]|uniref:FtsX-like permease family protein n=1 Tax=Dyella choica TaxID=1927959 RepID=A0A432M1J4_9GAMM|nr:FtsX-like permease family protein [Dyella choica]RUL71426.1 FtsX-like permease family protein [Dyella choica]
MQIRPVFTALRRHRLATLLIALEIALACAVLCNACFLIINRVQRMKMISGVDESSLAFVQLTGFETKGAKDLNARMLNGFGGIAGVLSAHVINTVPFGQQAGTFGISLERSMRNIPAVIDLYLGGPGSLEALGVKLVAGRAPQLADYVTLTNDFPSDAPVLITRSLAEHLWPGGDPLGKEFWSGGDYHYRVIGVVEHLAIAQPGSRGVASADWSAFAPVQPGPFLAGGYLLRTAPGEAPRVLRDARATAMKIAPDSVLDQDASQTVSDLRMRYFENDRGMTRILIGVIVSLLLVTALGIVGLASFWVGQRRKQIGIRRAIGATRGDILRYFLMENFLIVSFGVVLGIGLAYACNLMLMKRYELAHLPFYYLPLAAVALWVLGQLAVLGPALRAAAVPPVVATRSV